MATNANHENGEGTKGKKRMSAKKRRAKQRARIIIFVVELLVIVAMLIAVLKVFQTTEEVEGPHFAQIDESQIVVNSEVVEKFEEDEELKGYWNIALFGVDATDGQLSKGSRSDTIMVASINQDTGEIKLVSVYRDTYLNLRNDVYNKCNGAYSKGGAETAMAMLNMNLDLNITDFVTVGYDAVIDSVNGLKGVWIDVDSEEIKHINNYQKSILRDTDIDEELVMVEDTGYQLLNGLQAAAYCRIRYTAGDDFKRAERQREVIQAMADKAKTAKLSELTDTFFKVVDNVYTSIDKKDLQNLLGQIANYSIVGEDGFPQRNMLATENLGGARGSCVIPIDLTDNVVWLHEFLFGVEDYQVSSTVQECSDQIKADTIPYLNRSSN